jgi:hypothetical protein
MVTGRTREVGVMVILVIHVQLHRSDAAPLALLHGQLGPLPVDDFLLE